MPATTMVQVRVDQNVKAQALLNDLEEIGRK